MDAGQDAHVDRPAVTRQIPILCPVCQGRGRVPGGFYGLYDSMSPTSASEPCRRCGGTGTVWGYEMQGGYPAIQIPGATCGA